MLQWMGGSRRKVAASHTSVKKRQKQYFEQRRQKQHQVAVGAESCTNDINSGNQHPKEHQSLDILNLLNLSTATPECKPSGPENGMEDLDADFYNPKDNISGVGSSLNHKAEPTFSKRISISVLDNRTHDFKKANSTVDLMDGTERKLSVFDLVGDDTTINPEECSPSEAHMAFSVEGIGRSESGRKGLGKINTETPVNSPQPSDKNFAYRRPSQWKDTGQPDTSNVRERLDDFEKEVDMIIERSNIFQDDSHYRSPIGIHAKDGSRRQKLRTFSDHLHKSYINDSRSYFFDAADFNKSRISDDNEWNDKFPFPDNGESSYYWKDQPPCQMDSNHNFLKYGKEYPDSRSSEEHHGKKRRDYLKTTRRSNIEDSPVRRSHHLERTIDHPSFAKAANFKSHEKFDFDDVFDQPVWSSIVLDEDKDNLSLRSDESCSSSVAVWANETPNPLFETNTRQRKREINSFGNLEHKKYLNNDLLQESWEDWDVDEQYLKRKVGSGKQAIRPNPGKLNSTSQRKGSVDTPYTWFGEVLTSAGNGISSDITTERAKPYSFLNPKIGSSHSRSSPSPGSIKEAWFPKFSVGGTGDDDDDEHNYVNCLSAKHKCKLRGDICGFESDTLSENDNEEIKEVSHPRNPRDETSSSVVKSLSDENECNPKMKVMEARRQRNRGEKTRRDSLQQMIMLESRTLQLVWFNNETLLFDSLNT